MHILHTENEGMKIVVIRCLPFQVSDAGYGILPYFIPDKILADQYIYYTYHQRNNYGYTRPGESRQD